MEARVDDEGSGLNSPLSAVKNMRSKHKCEDTLLSICRSYGISRELYKPVCAKDGWGPCRTPPEASNAVCVFEAMLEAGVRFPLHELYNKVMTYFNLAPSQLVPNAWRQLAGFVLVCDDVGVTPMMAVFRHYFKLYSVGNGWYGFKVNSDYLFNSDGGTHVNTRWKERWFFLDSLVADNPWRCPREWGTPGKNRDDGKQPHPTETAWNAIYKLNAAKGDKGISLMKLIIDKSHYNQNFPVLPPLQEQVKYEAEEDASHDDAATPSTSTRPPKRLCLPAIEQGKAQQLTDQLQAVQAERDKAVLQVKEMRAELTVRSAAQAEHTSRVRQLEAEHATQVSRLAELHRRQEGMYMAKVQQLESELEAAQAEGAMALGQLKETRAGLTKAHAEHTHGVSQLRTAFEAAEAEHATRLLEERKEVEAKLQRLAEELEAEKAERAAEVIAVRAQCYSQIKAAAIKCISELMPEPLPAMENSKKLKKPKAWKHTQPITPAQLKQMRDEFWDTAPHCAGQKEIWDALRVATESDLAQAQTIVDCAGIIISNPDMTVCYDKKGAKYELPKYVLSEPTDLIRDG